MTDITDQADQWTQTATPGPWYVHTDPDDQDCTYIYDDTGHMCIAVAPAGSDYREADLTLAAAAPVLAEQIAGMRWEYVMQQAPPDKEIWVTFTSRAAWSPEALQGDLREMQERFPEYRHRIVRRLVGEPEVID